MLPFNTILWPTDFSDPSYAALAAAIELAAHFEAGLLCLHVLEPPPENSEWSDASSFTVPLSVEQDRDRADKELHRLISARVPADVEAETYVAVGDASIAIPEIARKEQVDLVVIATHGRTGWRRMVFGSVAEKVVRDAACPVLTVRAPRPAEQKEKGRKKQ